MKRYISAILLVVIILTGIIVPAKAVDNPELFTYKLNADGASYTVTGIKDKYVYSIVVPSEYNGLPVTTIGVNAFLDCFTNVTVVVIPENIKEIRNSAFAHFKKLRALSLPVSLEKIGWCAFYDSTSELKYIYYPGTEEQWADIDVDNCGLNGIDVNREDIFFSPAPRCHVTENIVFSTASQMTAGLEINQCMVCGEVLYERNTPQHVPNQPTFEAYNGKDGVHIRYYAYEGHDRYHFYRRTADTSWKRFYTASGRPICTCGAECLCDEFANKEIIDRDAKSGTTYYYTVKAENEAGFSAYDKSGYRIKYVKAPKLTEIVNEQKGVKISWNKVNGAEGYYVYRADITNSADFNYKKIASLNKQSTQSYLDSKAESGKKYAYMIKAYAGKAVSFGNYLEMIYLTTPKLTSVKNEKDGVHIKWNKVSGGHKYIVYRKTAKSGWTRLGRTTGNSFVDSTAKNGTTYYYTIKAQADYYKAQEHHPNTVELISCFSAYNKTGVQIRYITAPMITKTANEADGIRVSWKKVAGADGYYVYRRKTGTTQWTRIATVKKNSTVSYKDKNAVSGQRYDYTVKAYDGKMASGCQSLSRIYRLTVPSLKSAKRQGKCITLTWSEVKTADGYYVYRKTANGSWEQIGAVGGADNLRFTDSYIEKGKTYVYTVRAFKGYDRSYYNTKGLSVKF